MISMDMLLFIAFIVVIALLIYKDRRNVKLQGIVFMRRTKKGMKFIDNVAKSHPGFWHHLSILAVIVAIPALIFISLFLINNSIAILFGQVKEGVRLVLPWAVGQAKMVPMALLLPWWVWVIAVASVIVPHEFMHGIVCRLEKIRIKSIGWLLLVIIPGAFVEPDEAQLKKARRSTRLKVYAVGSFANFIVAGVFWILGFLLISSCYVSAGVIPSGVIADYPAAHVNMSGAIIAINNISVTSPDEISGVLADIPIGSVITIETTTGLYNITTVQHPELNKSFIGITGPYTPYYEPRDEIKKQGLEDTTELLRQLFFWIFLINLGVGLINLMPVKPLDGGLIFENIISKFMNAKMTKNIVAFVSSAMILILLFNLIGPVLV